MSFRKVDYIAVNLSLRQTLQSMLAAVKKGRSVNEAEIPPPVATGAPGVAPAPSVAPQPSPPEPSPPSNSSESTPVDQPAQSLPESVTPGSEEEQPSSSSSSLPAPCPVPTPEETTGETTEEPGEQPQTANEETKTMLAERQREYKMAALRAKKQGDLERARLYLKISKVCSKRRGFGVFLSSVCGNVLLMCVCRGESFISFQELILGFKKHGCTLSEEITLV